MSNFTLVISSTIAALNIEVGFDTLVEAQDKKGEMIERLKTVDGYVVDEWTTDFLSKGNEMVCFDIEKGVDEENESPWSEYEQGWRNIRADEAAAVARQNAEDLEYARRGPAPSYMGIRGSYEPDGGIIYEP